MAVMTEQETLVRPRSVVPGRQRWDAPMVLGRSDLAQRVETTLQDRPGVTAAQANPVTGRVLILHDPSMSGEDVGRLIRQAVGLAAAKAARHVQPTPLPGIRPTGISRPDATRRRMALVAGGAARVVTTTLS